MHAVPGLACPACRGDLRADGATRLTCQGCGASYPILDGIPSFVPGRALGRTSTVDLTVLIVGANQPGSLDGLLPALRQALRSLEITHELVVIDQGSAGGYGSALRSGFGRAQSEYILPLDADGSPHPSFLSATSTAPNAPQVVIPPP